MKILITAFDAFGGEAQNSAQISLGKLSYSRAEILKEILPTMFERSSKILREILLKEKPDAVLLLGQAAGRAELTPERVAINCMDAKIPDNAGFAPSDKKIREDGPAAYFSTLPIKKMVEYMRKKQIPASVSNTAGTFVCNKLMYDLLDLISTEHLRMCGGFLHVPLLPEQAEERKLPSLPLEKIVLGLSCSLDAIVDSISP